MSVTPSAKAAAIASAGISSITFGISSPAIVVPCNAEARTRSSPNGSPQLSPVTSSSMSAPMRRSTSTKPVRVGLHDIASSTRSDPGVIAAATAKNAADDGSPGTSRSKAAGAPASTRTRQPVDGDRHAQCTQHAFGVIATRSPATPLRSHRSPAARRADTRTSPARSRPGARGAFPAANRRESTKRCVRAVVAAVDVGAHRAQRIDDPTHRTRAERRIAREHREERTAGERTREHAHRRTAVLAVDDRRRARASTRRPGSRPPPRRRGRARVTPRSSSARRVAATSAPVARFVSVLRPSASAANISARCEIDLSPGTRRRPRNGRAPPKVSSAGTLTTGPAATCGSRARAAPVSNAAASAAPIVELEHTRRPFERVRDLDVRDVHTEATGGRRDLGQHAGPVGHRNEELDEIAREHGPHRKIAARRARPFEQLRERVAIAGRDKVACRAECLQVRVERLEHRVAIRREDVEPDRGMTRGDPRHVAKAAGRQPEQRAVFGFVRGRNVHQRRGRELRHMADERRPTRRDRRASPTPPRRRSRGATRAPSCTRPRRSSAVGVTHPGGADEQVGAARRRHLLVPNRPSGARRRIAAHDRDTGARPRRRSDPSPSRRR